MKHTIQDDNRSEVLILAEAMNNLAGALRETNQLVRESQMFQSPSEEMNLLQAVNELAQRVAILSTRIR